MTWNNLHFDAALEEEAPRVLEVNCPRCGFALEDDAEVCLDCGQSREDESWPRIDLQGEIWLGRRLRNRYLLRRLLGRGATGGVYLAELPNSQDRYAAKIIRFSDPKFGHAGRDLKSRVIEEIKILSRIRSPHVVKFVDSIEIAAHTVAVITTLVDGNSLDALLSREGPFAVDRAAEIARQVAVGMADVHLLGAVHRDLKPENILVESLRDGEFVYVIDFGIVRRREDVRETIGFIGTPAFASPEQAMGKDVGPASDIYGLGAVLFCMLTGEPPLMDKTAADILVRQVRDVAPRLSEAQPERDWPEELEALVAEMLAKQPEDRPQSMREVAERLSRILWRSEAPTGLHRLDEKSAGRIDLEAPARRRRRRAAQAAGDPARHTHSDDDPRTPAPGPRPFLPSKVWTAEADGRRAWARDGQIFVSDPSTEVSGEATVIWDVPIRPTALAFDRDCLLVGLADGSLVRVSLTDGDTTPILSEPGLSPLTAVGASPSGRIRVVSGGLGRTLCSIDGGPWEHLPSSPPVVSVAADDDTGLIAVGTADDTTLLVRPVHRLFEIEAVLVHDGPPVLLRFSEDGYLLAACIDDRRFELYDATSARLHSVRPGCRSSTAAAFSRAPVTCQPEQSADGCPHAPDL